MHNALASYVACRSAVQMPLIDAEIARDQVRECITGALMYAVFHIQEYVFT